MQHRNRMIARVTALVIVIAIMMSFTSALAVTAGIRYGGSTFRKGSSYSMSKMKSAFGTPRKMGECVGIYARYRFTRSGLLIYADQAKKNGSLKIKSMTITSSRISTLCGVKVGSRVNKKNGTYRIASGITVTVRSKKVTKIKFS